MEPEDVVIWRTIVFRVTKIIFGEPDAANPIYQRLVDHTLRWGNVKCEVDAIWTRTHVLTNQLLDAKKHDYRTSVIPKKYLPDSPAARKDGNGKR